MIVGESAKELCSTKFGPETVQISPTTVHISPCNLQPSLGFMKISEAFDTTRSTPLQENSTSIYLNFEVCAEDSSLDDPWQSFEGWFHKTS